MDTDAALAPPPLLLDGHLGLRETHISWVFLTADRAYKVKKPLVLPFLDYGSPAGSH
jgi:aminoglycoside phosphotransferase family enzyme